MYLKGHFPFALLTEVRDKHLWKVYNNGGDVLNGGDPEVRQSLRRRSPARCKATGKQIRVAA